jgi:hypothetical protein
MTYTGIAQRKITLALHSERMQDLCLSPDAQLLCCCRPEAGPRNETLHVVHRDDENGPAVLRVADWKLFANNSGR